MILPNVGDSGGGPVFDTSICYYTNMRRIRLRIGESVVEVS